MKILILPGLDGTVALLSEIVELLDSKHEVTAVRYQPDVFCYQDLETRVEALLPADEYIIVAESFSGPLAAMISAKKPNGLRGLAFVATFATTPIKVPAFLTYLVDIAPTKSRLLIRLAQPFLMGRWATPKFTTEFQQVMCAVPASTIAGRLREVLKVNVVKQLNGIEVPTIYLAAKNDRLVPSRMASDFCQSPHTVFEIEGPHFLLQANATDAAKCILDFAARFD
ncbi:pimeloyl-ACP methyl ester carboxylesterase [Litoreibacter meonggei]|uniref:Pimeloyl-ACP methyl ester carboxylesterase n=1 Tax=Litoreibacter meonggei TaxID=1049199 RepID=A0A497W543_9RHOB|nr:alpha/beta hydrolase [Litoreibacter meonggei]RLJ51571.1 pimeloyl-ACP methyl ester carboxylesterase [Litoreibacter meonggei]